MARGGSRTTDDDGDDDRRTTPWMPFAPLDALPPFGCPDDVVFGPPLDAFAKPSLSTTAEF